nr:type II toxin-antitoxin system RelE/ParE family toxin [Pleomorphomonas sp. NRK KF1]
MVALPEEVRRHFGHAFHLVQCGEEPLDAKALKGFGGRSVLEIVEDHDSDTFRAVYTVRFVEAVYVLHVFQKKSKKGAETPKHEIDLIKQRLRDAEEHYRQHFNKGGR